jgi:hypothetical protein
MFVSLYLIGLVAIALAVLLLGFVMPARRSRELENVAHELSFKFYARATPFEGTDVLGLAILQDGPSTVVKDLLERSNGQFRLLIFDVDSLPLESTNAPLTTTVAAFQAQEAHLPVFQLGERNMLERAAEHVERVLGKKMSRSDDVPEFAGDFFVYSPAKGEVRSFLTPAKLSYLRDHAPHLYFESSQTWLLMYRFGVTVETGKLKEFSEIASTLASVLLSSQMPKAA